MGGRIDARADAAIAGRPMPGGMARAAADTGPGPSATAGNGLAWALCRGRLAGAAQDQEQG
jgi:hypothetical protein